MTARFVKQTLLLGVIGSAVGFALNATSSHGVSLTTPVYPTSASATVCADPEGTLPPPREHTMIALEEALTACDACTAGFVDARGAAAFAHGHVPGAIHLPPGGCGDAETDVLAPLRAFDTLIVYDDDARLRLARGVADRLVAAGFDNVRVLEGSWAAWESARGPAQAGACQACEHTSSTRSP